MRSGKDFRKVKIPKKKKNVLSLSPTEGGCCSSETNHDRRKAPPKNEVACFRQDITKTKIKNLTN
jgi:hypothetical protein